MARSQATTPQQLHPVFHTGPKDIGVALAVLLALTLGWLLFMQTSNRTRQFQDGESPFRMSYPATWTSTDSLQDLLLKVEDPLTASAYKTMLSVEQRLLDPASLPAMQTLIDRRVEDRAALTGYHFLGSSEAQVAGAPATELQYAYLVQPLDTPRSASLPVVVHAREYIVLAGDTSYYITLAAPAETFERYNAQFNQIIETVVLQ